MEDAVQTVMIQCELGLITLVLMKPIKSIRTGTINWRICPWLRKKKRIINNKLIEKLSIFIIRRKQEEC